MSARTLLLTLALLLGPLVPLAPLAPASAAPAPPVTVDSAPAQEGAAWLVSQLRDGVIPDGTGINGGFTVDTGLALAAVGEHDADVRRISAAFAKRVTEYISGDAGGDVGSTYAGATAKSIVFAQVAGADPRHYGGQDLVARLEGRVATTGPGAGRISDQSVYPDNANTIGQAFAARGLEAAGSSEAAAVTAYLLKQQCAAGFFDLDLSQLGTSCDASPTASGSTDTTAYAILSLQAQAAQPAVADALRRAESWLAGNQLASGAFDDATYGVNTNTTGLAAWAMGTTGHLAVAGRASEWLRGHQLILAGRCATFARADEGALAYDATELAAAGQHPISSQDRSEFQLATAQALPGVMWAPDGTGPRRTSRALARVGTTRQVVDHASPGDIVCVDDGHTRRAVRVGLSGVVRVPLPLPTVAARRTISVHDGDQLLETVHLQVLGATRFVVSAPARVTIRGTSPVAVVVRVRGLARGERAVVLVGPHRRATVVGSRSGHARVTLRLAAHPGHVRIRVRGAYPDIRAGVTSVVVEQ